MNLLTVKQVASKLSISRSQVWRLVRAGTLPAPIRLSAQVVRWVESDLEANVLTQKQQNGAPNDGHPE